MVTAAAVLGLVAGLAPLGSPAQARPATDTSLVAPAPAASSSAMAESAPDVLIIGDSTTVHMLREFQAALAARGLDATVDARSGRTTYEGRGVLARYDLTTFDHVVVLLGANGKRENARRDMRALRRAGVDTMATVQAPRGKKVNQAVRAVFAGQRIRWAGFAAKRGIGTTDGKHYTRAAYRVRARYLARQIAARVS